MTQQPTQERRKLTTMEQVICAWPLVLVVIGGAIGGAFGGAAWVLNTRIMASSMTAPMRYGLIVLTGLAAAALWYVAAGAILSMIAGGGRAL